MAGLYIISFVLGAVIGSFLNVVALRIRTGVGLGGRSKCMSCGKTLYWQELIPVLSFVFLSGKCRGCKAQISWQYPVVELLTGFLFVFILSVFPPASYLALVMTLIHLVVACILVVIAVYDVRHKIIPDSLVYAFDILALLTVFMSSQSWFTAPHVWTILAGPILALPFALLWAVSNGRWIGLGDSKLVLGIGWLLGLNAGANAVILAFWIGAAVSVIWLLATMKGFRKGTEIPFGPFLILGFYLVLLSGLEVIDFRILGTLF